jgi:hypothetical protein
MAGPAYQFGATDASGGSGLAMGRYSWGLETKSPTGRGARRGKVRPCWVLATASGMD